jgi:DNA-binding transcriptional LysR family regulator
MDLEALRLTLALADLGSITAAAARLGLSKSRASQRLQALEQELGVHLFTRTTRAVRPTPDGEHLIQRARPLLAEADELAALFQGPRHLKGKIRVDLPTAFARTAVIPKLPELLALHPQLELELSTSDRRVDLLREGFDCVLRIGPLHESSLTAIRLGILTMANCVSPAYALRYGLPRDLGDLAQHWIVHYSPTLTKEDPTFEHLEGDFISQLPMRSLLTVNSIDAYRAACYAGLGIIQIPRYGAAEDLAAGRLIEVLPAHPAAPMPISIVHPHGRQVPRRVRVFMTWLATLVEPLVS